MHCVTPYVMNMPSKPTRYSKASKHTVVPCNKCFACVSRRRQGWTFRLMEEAKVSSSVSFVTFTYDDENLKWSTIAPTLHRPDLTLFFKRLRHNTENPFKYYSCGEYGTQTYRPHHHAIIYNLPSEMATPSYQHEYLTNLWKQGRVQVDAANEKTMAYTAGYVNKKIIKAVEYFLDEMTGELRPDDREKEYSTMSKHLGASFLTPEMITYLRNHNTDIVMRNGFKQLLPRYYRDKVFDTPELKSKLIYDKYLKAQEREDNNQSINDEQREYLIKQHLKTVKNERIKI